VGAFDDAGVHTLTALADDEAPLALVAVGRGTDTIHRAPPN
jgi:hypothetical protein